MQELSEAPQLSQRAVYADVSSEIFELRQEFGSRLTCKDLRV